MASCSWVPMHAKRGQMHALHLFRSIGRLRHMRFPGMHARNKRIPRTCTHVTPPLPLRVWVRVYTGQRHNANNNLSPSSHPSSQIPADAGWLEQPLHGGLVLSRRGWPPAFLAHNGERHRQVWTPLGSWRARAPHERGRGTSFSVWPQPRPIILPCSSVIPCSRRRGEDVLERHVLNDEILAPPPSLCLSPVVRAPENLRVGGRGHVRGSRPITGYMNKKRRRDFLLLGG